jgi:cell wall-associated NlpC family hydrolase
VSQLRTSTTANSASQHAASTGTTTSGSSSSGEVQLQTAEDVAVSRLAALLASGSRPPPFLIPIYKAAARRYHISWTVLAAINAVETDYGRNVSVSSAGAVGWMQFMPATWKKYGVAVTGKGSPDPYDPRDAIFAAARYLRANGGMRHLRRAVFAYNHAAWYVSEVMWLSEKIGGTPPTSSARQKLSAMRNTAELLNGLPYIYGGGHAGWTFSDGYDCSGFVSAILHAAGYLNQPVTTQTLAAQSDMKSGAGRWVTIFDRTDAPSTREDHVIIDINGQWWESGGGSSSGGASVHRMTSVSASYLRGFNLVLHPRAL